MNVPLILLLICMNLQSMASQLPKPDTSVFVTINHYYSNQDYATITAREEIDSPAAGDEQYSLTLSLINNKWTPQQSKTNFFRWCDTMRSETTAAPIPPLRLQNLFRLLNDSAWRHMHMHCLFTSAKTMKQFCNNSSEWMELCKSPSKFLAAIKTFRRTSWAGAADARELNLMFHEHETGRNREKYRQAMQALYEKTKSSDDEKEYKALIHSMANQAIRQANTEAHMHMYFSLWRQGVFQEVEWHEKQAAKKRDLENYKKKLSARKKERSAWLKQRLAVRPQKIKDLFAQKELKRLNKENTKLQKKLKKIELKNTIRK